MIRRYATTAALALLASLAFGGVAMATGAGTAPAGPSGSPCAAPHPVCKIVNGKTVCATPKPVPGCGGG